MDNLSSGVSHQRSIPCSDKKPLVWLVLEGLSANAEIQLQILDQSLRQQCAFLHSWQNVQPPAIHWGTALSKRGATRSLLPTTNRTSLDEPNATSFLSHTSLLSGYCSTSICLKGAAELLAARHLLEQISSIILSLV